MTRILHSHRYNYYYHHSAFSWSESLFDLILQISCGVEECYNIFAVAYIPQTYGTIETNPITEFPEILFTNYFTMDFLLHFLCEGIGLEHISKIPRNRKENRNIIIGNIFLLTTMTLLFFSSSSWRFPLNFYRFLEMFLKSMLFMFYINGNQPEGGAAIGYEVITVQRA